LKLKPNKETVVAGVWSALPTLRMIDRHFRCLPFELALQKRRSANQMFDGAQASTPVLVASVRNHFAWLGLL